MIEPPHSATPGKVVLLLGLIFVFGMVAGASLFYVGQRSVGPRGPGGGPPPGEGRRPPSPLADMTRRLELSEQQQEQVRQILDTYRGRIDGVLEESRLAIREVLTEDQQLRFDTIRPRRSGGGPGPPGGPRRKNGRRKAPPPG